MSGMSSLATDKDIASMLLDLSNIISVLVGGVLGFIAKYFLEFKKMKADKKSLRQQMITNNIAPMRQEWINDLRKSSAKFISTSAKLNNKIFDLEILKNKFNPDINDHPTIEILNTIVEISELIFKLNELYTYVNILLPFSSKDNNEYRAERLRSCMKIICNSAKILISDKSSAMAHMNMANKIHQYLENHTMKLLKKEWEVTKSLKEIE